MKPAYNPYLTEPIYPAACIRVVDCPCTGKPGNMMHTFYQEALNIFGNKQAALRFRGLDLTFTLSQGLFSSADIDTGTRFLLKVLSKCWDQDAAEGLPLPATVLDAGSGVGVIGTALGAALKGQEKLLVRCQDRDELARVFTIANARANHVPPDVLEAYTEPLLNCPPGSSWDLIISNIPAKTGKPVLEDFVRGSAELLSSRGKVLVVIVNPLAAIFRTWIIESGLVILHEETGKDHTVFLYSRGKDFLTGKSVLDITDDGSPYIRNEGPCELEGEVFTIRTFHGAADFDNPGMLVQNTAKLISRLNLAKKFHQQKIKILIHEPGQGHLPVWLSRYFGDSLRSDIILSGRNILSLGAAQYNLKKHGQLARVLPAIDLGFDKNQIGQLLEKNDDPRLIVAFQEVVPGVERWGAIWEGLPGLLRPGDVAVMGFTSSEADRFDRIKPKGFSRLNDLKRNGFRVMAYQRT